MREEPIQVEVERLATIGAEEAEGRDVITIPAVLTACADVNLTAAQVSECPGLRTTRLLSTERMMSHRQPVYVFICLNSVRT